MKKQFIILGAFCISIMLTACSNVKKSEESLQESSNQIEDTSTRREQGEDSQTLEDSDITNSSNSDMDETSDSWQEEILKKIYEQEESYKNYNVELFTQDYSGDGTQQTYVVFIPKDVSKEDTVNYKVDLWFGTPSDVKEVKKDIYILPSTYGVHTINQKKYFRYDEAYATESFTVLLELDQSKQPKVAFRAPGAALFTQGSNDFTVTNSAYDLIYMDEMYSGHTWKNYYFYVDEKGFHEYVAKEIPESEFEEYSNANEIKKEIEEAYKTKGKLKLNYLQRENGLLHINIVQEENDSIVYHYKTYQIKGNQLEFVEEGDGSYVAAIWDVNAE